MPTFKGGEGEGPEGEPVAWEDLPPEGRKALQAGLAEQMMQQMMSLVLQTAGAVASGVPRPLLMAVLQGCCAGCNRAVGFLEGDVVGNVPADFKGPEGQSIEEVMAADRERLRLLGREDRGRLKDAAAKAVAEAAASQKQIGFKMSGKATVPGGKLDVN